MYFLSHMFNFCIQSGWSLFYELFISLVPKSINKTSEFKLWMNWHIAHVSFTNDTYYIEQCVTWHDFFVLLLLTFLVIHSMKLPERQLVEEWLTVFTVYYTVYTIRNVLFVVKLCIPLVCNYRQPLFHVSHSHIILLGCCCYWKWCDAIILKFLSIK